MLGKKIKAKAFYLDVVGYKEKILLKSLVSPEQFYLNVVGYKVKAVENVSMKAIRVLSERSGI